MTRERAKESLGNTPSDRFLYQVDDGEMIVQLMMRRAASDQGEVTPERLVGRYQLNPNFVFDVATKDGRLMV